ncbi:hypothetical protein AC790_17805 [Pantoea sp. RIT-PI-b]|nr:hypothetical protein AC790_17805 [Pantoea sp. RIT-PI-b]
MATLRDSQPLEAKKMHCYCSAGVEATSLPAERVRDSRASRRDAARGGAEQERIAAGPSGIVNE